MGAIAQVLFNLFGGLFMLIGRLWGYKLALAAVISAAYLSCYVAFLAAIAALTALVGRPIIQGVNLGFLWQFFPSLSAVTFAITMIFGSMAIKKACEYWVAALHGTIAIVK